MAALLTLHSFEQLLEADSQGDRQRFDHRQRRVSHAALHATDVGTVEPAARREVFLRKVAFFAEFPQTFPESNGQ